LASAETHEGVGHHGGQGQKNQNAIAQPAIHLVLKKPLSSAPIKPGLTHSKEDADTPARGALQLYMRSELSLARSAPTGMIVATGRELPLARRWASTGH
jgi:hypothetical protein